MRDTGAASTAGACRRPARHRGVDRRRMERAGGTAEIDSAPGSGTEVHLRLPVEAA